MKKAALAIGTMLGIALLAAAVLHVYWGSISGFGNTAAVAPTILANDGAGASAAANTIVDVPTEPAPALEKTYSNKTYRFSVKMPGDFAARELPPDMNGGHAIVLQNEKGDGVQIYVTPDKDHNTTLTANDVRAAIPDMQVVDAQDVEIGENNKGVAFRSSNENFGGNSREVWFFFRGNLYQISTYARLDPLLRSMFSTWQFF